MDPPGLIPSRRVRSRGLVTIVELLPTDPIYRTEIAIFRSANTRLPCSPDTVPLAVWETGVQSFRLTPLLIFKSARTFALQLEKISSQWYVHSGEIQLSPVLTLNAFWRYKNATPHIVPIIFTFLR